MPRPRKIEQANLTHANFSAWRQWAWRGGNLSRWGLVGLPLSAEISKPGLGSDSVTGV